MSIIETIKRLITGSDEAQEATKRMIDVLAKEAIKTGNPDALVAVAAQWEQMIEGTPVLQAANPIAALPSADSHTPEELIPYVIKIMQQAYLGGVLEVTTGTIQKQLNSYMIANDRWRAGDLEDVDPRPGIQHRWKRTLSMTLKNMLSPLHHPSSPPWFVRQR